MKYNIFQGNDLLTKTVAKSLGYEMKEKSNFSLTSDMYFEAYFYLCNRFGNPIIIDDYKKIMIWSFEVKNYNIRIELNSSWVSFIVFGDYRLQNRFTNNSYWVKIARQRLKKSHLIIPFYEENEIPKDKKELINRVFNEFCKIEGIDDSWSNEKFQKEKGMKWFDYVNNHNNEVIGVDYESFTKKHGTEYSNSKIRHALKTLKQFINNMLTPIWVRDCAFNIKGRLSDEEALYFERHKRNINIEYLKH